MNFHDEIGAARETAEKADLAAVERVYERIASDGVLAGVEQLLTFCHEDVEMRAYAAQAAGVADERGHDLLRGRDEVLAFFRTRVESGFTFQIRTRGFDVDTDTVLVRGSIRVARPDGSFAETNLRWRLHFRDGLVDEINWEPRAGD